MLLAPVPGEVLRPTTGGTRTPTPMTTAIVLLTPLPKVIIADGIFSHNIIFISGMLVGMLFFRRSSRIGDVIEK